MAAISGSRTQCGTHKRRQNVRGAKSYYLPPHGVDRCDGCWVEVFTIPHSVTMPAYANVLTIVVLIEPLPKINSKPNAVQMYWQNEQLIRYVASRWGKVRHRNRLISTSRWVRSSVVSGRCDAIMSPVRGVNTLLFFSSQYRLEMSRVLVE